MEKTNKLKRKIHELTEKSTKKSKSEADTPAVEDDAISISSSDSDTEPSPL